MRLQTRPGVGPREQDPCPLTGLSPVVDGCGSAHRDSAGLPGAARQGAPPTPCGAQGQSRRRSTKWSTCLASCGECRRTCKCPAAHRAYLRARHTDARHNGYRDFKRSCGTTTSERRDPSIHTYRCTAIYPSLC